jgi:hypothetical protein
MVGVHQTLIGASLNFTGTVLRLDLCSPKVFLVHFTMTRTLISGSLTTTVSVRFAVSRLVHRNLHSIRSASLLRYSISAPSSESSLESSILDRLPRSNLIRFAQGMRRARRLRILSKSPNLIHWVRCRCFFIVEVQNRTNTSCSALA